MEYKNIVLFQEINKLLLYFMCCFNWYNRNFQVVSSDQLLPVF